MMNRGKQKVMKRTGELIGESEIHQRGKERKGRGQDNCRLR